MHADTSRRSPFAVRRRSTPWPLIAALATCAFTVSFGASAQTQRSGGGASNQIMQQYQQVSAERAALQADNAKLKKDLEAATAERDALKKERDALKAKAGSGEASAAQLAEARRSADASVEQQKKKTEEVVARFRETAIALQEVEKDRAVLKTELAARDAELGQCAQRNVELGQLTDDVLTRYEHQGWFHKATIDEPFTRITRTRVQNLVDSDRARAEALKVAQPAAGAAPPATP